MHSPTKKTTIIPILGACAALLLPVADAKASGWRHFPPNMCTPLSGNTAPATNLVGQAYNPSASASTQWACPVVTDSNFPGSTASYAQAWGYSNGYEVEATSCRTYYGGGGTGGACSSPQTYTGGPGTWYLQWSPQAAWTQANAADSLYMSLTLGPENNGSYDVLFGYGFSQ